MCCAVTLLIAFPAIFWGIESFVNLLLDVRCLQQPKYLISPYYNHWKCLWKRAYVNKCKPDFQLTSTKRVIWFRPPREEKPALSLSWASLVRMNGPVGLSLFLNHPLTMLSSSPSNSVLRGPSFSAFTSGRTPFLAWTAARILSMRKGFH